TDGLLGAPLLEMKIAEQLVVAGGGRLGFFFNSRAGGARAGRRWLLRGSLGRGVRLWSLRRFAPAERDDNGQSFILRQMGEVVATLGKHFQYRLAHRPRATYFKLLLLGRGWLRFFLDATQLTAGLLPEARHFLSRAHRFFDLFGE